MSTLNETSSGRLSGSSSMASSRDFKPGKLAWLDGGNGASNLAGGGANAAETEQSSQADLGLRSDHLDHAE